MSDETLKQIGRVPESGAGRDAVHIAVVPVVAAEDLKPGDSVIVRGRTAVKTSANPNRDGIADPFRTDAIPKGTRFWLFLNPGSITSLRHVWTHPALPDEAGVAENEDEDGPGDDVVADSREWLARFAAEHDEEYKRVMRWATRYQDTGQQEIGGMEWLNYESPPEFWSHWGVVTGRTPTRSGDFWTCDC